MVIMDEASQCNTAVSLVPVVRGNNLMLVGDPQQLNPVILLDPAVNQKLRKNMPYRRNMITYPIPFIKHTLPATRSATRCFCGTITGATRKL